MSAQYVDDLEQFDMDIPFVGRCSYDQCVFAESPDNNDMGTVWLHGMAFRFHPQCQRLWAKADPVTEEEEETEQ